MTATPTATARDQRAPLTIAMAIGAATGVNPLICGLAVMIGGDAVLYYPAQSVSSLVVYERGYLGAQDIFKFGMWMTLIAIAVVLVVALPYWAAVGVPLPGAVAPAARRLQA